MDRFICIHAHLYQPPRENPWLEAVELQDSAYPYHDWNERITRECYAPNGAARLLDGEGRIVRILNNYSKISFNFGPTLLSYFETECPDVLEAIVRADKMSQKQFSGHGTAMAQAYNHMIMPLASRRDKRTQVQWGIRDFQSRFGRDPEGMWLPETAVDIESLEVLAEAGIRFTVLAPHQARRVRELDGGEWQDVAGGRIDPTRVYRQNLPSGRSIALFFYDGPISQAVAFERLLTQGEHLAHRLESAFFHERNWPQLVHIATDGETYGHHHRHGEMALAYALHFIEKHDKAKLTVYGEYLERFPPSFEVEILENTAWSCSHRVERWRSDCGCNSGGRPGWNQAWRKPLRESLDWLRDTLTPRYEEAASRYLKDPWAARDDYINVVLDRSAIVLDAFLATHGARDLDEQDKRSVLMLLEFQRNAMLMYTSCGWFFDDVSGIETVQIIRYAGRTLQLAERLFDERFEAPFLKLLEKARSNVPEQRNGRTVYERHVRPAMVDLEKVAAHYAVNSLFERDTERKRVYCYSIDLKDYHVLEAGRARFVMGQARVTSEITRSSAHVSFGASHFGDHNVSAGVRRYGNEVLYQALLAEAQEALDQADFPRLVLLIDREFGSSTYSLKSLFRDAQREVMHNILKSALKEIEAEYEAVYHQRMPLMRFFGSLGLPLPQPLQAAAECVLNAKIREALQAEPLDIESIEKLVEEGRAQNVKLDAAGLGYSLQLILERKTEELFGRRDDVGLIEEIDELAQLGASSIFDVDLWKVQNGYYELFKKTYLEMLERSKSGDVAASSWVHAFRALGENLSLSVS